MLNIPTISSLYTNIKGNLETEYGVPISPIGKVFLRALAMVQAGKIYLLYLAIGDVQKNVFPDTADPESQGGTLERSGRLKGLIPFQGTQGQYIVAVTGSAGAVINASTTFKSDDSSLNPGFLFALDNSYTLTGSADTITLRCLTVGTDALLNVSDTLTCTQPLVNVSASVTVSSISISPVDAETTEEFRARVLQTYVLEPQGGASSDYRLWVATVAGVKQSYPYAESGATGVVDVFVEAILSDSTDGKGTPTMTILNNVTTVLSDANGLVPIDLIVNVQPISVQTVVIGFTGSTGSPGISADQQTLITDALIEYVATIRPFIPGADLLTTRNDTLNTNGIIQTALNAAPGSYWTGIILTVNGISVTTYNFDLGQIPYLNPVIIYT